MIELKPDFLKYPDGLIPAIIQDADTRIVLMLGFMNKEAMHKTIETKLVTFYSRTRKRLWTKGEVSNNYLHLVEIKIDCDSDTILIKRSLMEQFAIQVAIPVLMKKIKLIIFC